MSTDAYGVYMAALLEGDVRGLGSVIQGLADRGVPWAQIVQEYIQRGLYDIGRMWERNQIPVSVEHLAASATSVILASRYIGYEPETSAPEVVIACVPGELHEIGTMIVANACEAAGWKAVLLASDTPTHDLIAFIRKRKRVPDVVALSVTLPANRRALQDELVALTTAFPALPIIFGGQALNGHSEAIAFREHLLLRFPTVQYIQTLDALERFLTQAAEMEHA